PGRDRAPAAAAALGLLLAATGATAAPTPSPSGREILVRYPQALSVVDLEAADDWGLVPLSGTVEAAVFVREQAVLLLHSPARQELSVVDARRYSPTRYQVLASYRSPELSRRGMRFVASASRYYLAAGRTAVAVVDPRTLLAKLGVYTFDFLPMVDDTAQHVALDEGFFALRNGQLSVEDPRSGMPAPQFVRLTDRPLELLADPSRSRLYLSASRPGGTGALLVLDARTRSVVHELNVSWPITSMAWLEDGAIGLLSAPRRLVAVYDPLKDRWGRVFSLKAPGTPLGLLSLAEPQGRRFSPLQEDAR
ncbi:MAG TPA: hypothetical protein V6D00_10940, partial [Pantanalinema sp.]